MRGFLRSFVLASLLASGAQAVPVILSNSLNSNPDPGSGSTISSTTWSAVNFSTQGQSLTLASVTAPIHFVAPLGGASSGANLVVSLYSDLAGVPGASLVALSFSPPLPPFNGTDASSVVFTPVAPFTLLPATSYWIVAGAPGASGASPFSWLFAQGARTGPGFLGTRAVSNNSGGSWATFSNADMGMLVLAESADAVPELDTRTIIQPFFMVTLLLGGAISVRRG